MLEPWVFIAVLLAAGILLPGVAIVFMFPWAVAYDKLQLYMVMEGVIFILILAAGLAYAWRKGVLEWV